MIFSLEGPQGMGKTLMGVAICYEGYSKYNKKIICNNHLAFPYTLFSVDWFLENLHTTELEDSILFLDEAYQYMDSRLSTSKLSRLFTWFIVQTRKRGVDLYYCTHSLENVDIRLRRSTDIRGSCSYYGENPCKKCKGTGMNSKGLACERCLGKGETGLATTYFMRVRRKRGEARRFKLEAFGPKFWDMYNTKERMPIRSQLIQGIDTTERV